MNAKSLRACAKCVPCWQWAWAKPWVRKSHSVALQQTASEAHRAASRRLQRSAIPVTCSESDVNCRSRSRSRLIFDQTVTIQPDGFINLRGCGHM